MPPRRSVRSGRGLMALALLAFFSLGLPDGVLGVAWPSIRGEFGVPIDRLGLLLVAATAGYLASSVAGGWLVQRLGVGGLLTASSGLIVASAFGYAFLTEWAVFPLCALIAGLGAGAIDTGINVFAVSRFAAGTVTWLHASYGAGATVGPLLITATLTMGLGWRFGYGVLGLLLGGMTLGFGWTRDRWQLRRDDADRLRTQPASLGATLTCRRVWPGIVVFFVYTGLEVAAGQWTYSLLTEARSVDSGTAGAAVSAYWASFTAGRLVAGALVRRAGSGVVLRAALVSAPAAGALLWFASGPAGHVVALIALGVSLAPVYPLVMAETAQRVGDHYALHAVGLQVSAAYLGAGAIPAAIGVAARVHGLDVVGPALVVLPAMVLALHQIGIVQRAPTQPGLPLPAPRTRP